MGIEEREARQPDAGYRQDEPQARDGPAHEALGEGLAGAVDHVEDEADDDRRDDERNEHEKPGSEVAADAEWHRTGFYPCAPYNPAMSIRPAFLLRAPLLLVVALAGSSAVSQAPPRKPPTPARGRGGPA